MKEIKLKQVSLWFVLMVGLLLGAGVAVGGNDPETKDQTDQVFDQSLVHEIKITNLDPQIWEKMRKNERGLRRRPQKATVKVDNVTLEEVGVATAFLRKDDPDFYLYPNLRVGFGVFRSGQRLSGVRGIDLKGFGSDDQSLIVERLAWELFFQFGVPASRTAYAKLTVNGEYIGAYLMIESVSDVIARPPFANDRGNLYKLKNTSRSPNGPDAFALAPENPRDPKSYIMERRSEHKPFEKPVGNPDGKDLVELIHAFNHATPETLRVEVEKRLDLNGLINYLAVDMALTDTDGLIAYVLNPEQIYFQNNTFFYRPLKSEKFFVMPDDLDAAFDAYDYQSFSRDLLDGWHLMRITKLLLDNADLRDRYFDRFQTFVNQFYDPVKIMQRIDDLADQIKPAVIEDLERPTPPPVGRRMTKEEWEARLDRLHWYVQDRADSLQQQLLGVVKK